MKTRYSGAKILDGLDKIKALEKGQVEFKTQTLSPLSEKKLSEQNLNYRNPHLPPFWVSACARHKNGKQGQRHPQGPAIALLRIAEQHPKIFSELH